MNSKDLRIGNACIEKYSKEIIFVTALKSVHEGVEVIEFTGDFSGKWQAEYIPITEQWLLNLGFEKHPDYFCKEIKPCKTFILAKESHDDVYFLCDCDVDTELKYVHQLQNLYFALTNTELILKSIP